MIIKSRRLHEPYRYMLADRMTKMGVIIDVLQEDEHRLRSDFAIYVTSSLLDQK